MFVTLYLAAFVALVCRTAAGQNIQLSSPVHPEKGFNFTMAWAGGTPPYLAGVLNYKDQTVAYARSGAINTNTWTFTCDGMTVGTDIVFAVIDSSATRLQVISDPVPVLAPPSIKPPTDPRIGVTSSWSFSGGVPPYDVFVYASDQSTKLFRQLATTQTTVSWDFTSQNNLFTGGSNVYFQVVDKQEITITSGPVTVHTVGFGSSSSTAAPASQTGGASSGQGTSTGNEDNQTATGTGTATGDFPTGTGGNDSSGGGGGGKKSSNTGAIAGGVVGGLVALGLVGGLVYFLLARKKEQKKRYYGGGDYLAADTAMFTGPTNSARVSGAFTDGPSPLTPGAAYAAAIPSPPPVAATADHYPQQSQQQIEMSENPFKTPGSEYNTVAGVSAPPGAVMAGAMNYFYGQPEPQPGALEAQQQQRVPVTARSSWQEPIPATAATTGHSARPSISSANRNSSVPTISSSPPQLAPPVSLQPGFGITRVPVPHYPPDLIPLPASPQPSEAHRSYMSSQQPDPTPTPNAGYAKDAFTVPESSMYVLTPDMPMSAQSAATPTAPGANANTGAHRPPSIPGNPAGTPGTSH